MIINNNDAEKRLNSPLNLMNRLNDMKSERKNAMSLFTGVKKEESKEIKIAFNPFKEAAPDIAVESTLAAPQESHPTIDNLISNNNDQVRLSLAHDAALGVLNNAVSMLAAKLEDVKADKLPSVITATSKVVESIRRERLEISKTKDREVHYHFYTPEQKKISDYEIIDVG